jgi:hydroxyacylglutathione hydrolase
LAEDAILVDTRSAADFAAAHIPGAINIPHNNSFTTWAGWLLDYERPFYLIADPSAVSHLIRDLTYIGLDNAAGYFDSSILAAWGRAGHGLQSYGVITPAQLASKISRDDVAVIDVRNVDEWQSGHISGAQHIMLGHLSDRLAEVPVGKSVVVQCRSGARSAIGASLLQAKGILEVMNLQGGIRAWAAAGLPIERRAFNLR